MKLLNANKGVPIAIAKITISLIRTFTKIAASFISLT